MTRRSVPGSEDIDTFVDQYLKYGDQWANELYEAVGRVTVASATVEFALFSLASHLDPSSELYGRSIESFRSVIQRLQPSLAPALSRRVGQQLTASTVAMRRRNEMIHLAWSDVPLHDSRHMGVGTKRASSGEGLAGMMKSTAEIAALGERLHQIAQDISELERDIAQSGSTD